MIGHVVGVSILPFSMIFRLNFRTVLAVGSLFFILLLINVPQNTIWAVVAVIVWQMELQLPMQSVPITTDVGGGGGLDSSPGRGVQLYVIKFVSDSR